MKKFEIGKRYTEGGVTFEVLSRTAKTVKMALIQHAGRANEKNTDIKKQKSPLSRQSSVKNAGVGTNQ